MVSLWKCKKNRNTVFCLQLLALVSLSGLFYVRTPQASETAKKNLKKFPDYCIITKRLLYLHSHKTECTMYDDEEELKARIEAAEKDLSFFSLYWDDIRETDWISDEELEGSVNDALDDLIDAKNKLKESGSPP